MPNQPDAEDLWTPVTVSSYFNVPVTTLYQWRHHGYGPRSIKVGRHLRYRRRDVLEWLDQQAAGS